MNKYSLFAAILFCLFSCAREERQNVYSVFTSDAPMCNKFDWSSVEPFSFSKDSLSDNTIHFRSVWDKDSLYFRFDVEDTRLWALQTERDHKKLWEDDIVELLIDAENHYSKGWKTDDIIYHINVLGTVKDDRGREDGRSDASWNGKARWIVDVRGTICDNSDIDEGYTVRIAIPWNEIGKEAADGLALGFTFGYDDNDGVAVSWKPLCIWTDAEPTRSPEQFGQLILKK